MPLEGSEKAEGFRTESEDPQNRSHPFFACGSELRVG